MLCVSLTKDLYIYIVIYTCGYQASRANSVNFITKSVLGIGEENFENPFCLSTNRLPKSHYFFSTHCHMEPTHQWFLLILSMFFLLPQLGHDNTWHGMGWRMTWSRWHNMRWWRAAMEHCARRWCGHAWCGRLTSTTHFYSLFSKFTHFYSCRHCSAFKHIGLQYINNFLQVYYLRFTNSREV